MHSVNSHAICKRRIMYYRNINLQRLKKSLMHHLILTYQTLRLNLLHKAYVEFRVCLKWFVHHNICFHTRLSHKC